MVTVPSVLRRGGLVSIELVLRGIESPLSLNASLWNSRGDLQFTSTHMSRSKGRSKLIVTFSIISPVCLLVLQYRVIQKYSISTWRLVGCFVLDWCL